jgi:adenine-specific DNA glycosylase
VRVIFLKEIIEIKNDKFQWVNFSELHNIGMPTPVKKLLDDFVLG